MSKNIDIARTGVARNLKRLRMSRHQSHADVAEGTGLTPRTISDIEKGHRKRVFDYTLVRLAKYFDTTPDKLLEKPRWQNFRGILYPAVAVLAIAVAIFSYIGSTHSPWVQFEGNTISTEKWDRTFPCTINKAVPFNWDGREIIAITLACTSEESASLQILDAANGETIYSVFPDYDELESIFDASLFETGNFLPEDFVFANLHGDGTHQLCALFRHNVWYPSYLITINSDFKPIGIYYHPGHLNHILVSDFDHDSKDELLVSATSNVRGYEGGAFLIFDDEHLSGAAVDSISHSDKVLHSGLRDGSLRRIMLPSMSDEFLNLAGTSRLDGHHSHGNTNKNGQTEITISLMASDKSFLLKVDPDLNLLARLIPTDPIRKINEEWIERGQISRDYLSPDFLDDWASRILRFEEGRLHPMEDKDPEP